ncbi:MAG: hypothetical protein AAB446_01625 [Patescibacteria group bacterium]
MTKNHAVLIMSFNTQEIRSCLPIDRRVMDSGTIVNGTHWQLPPWFPTENAPKSYQMNTTISVDLLKKIFAERAKSPHTYPEWFVLGVFSSRQLINIDDKKTEATTRFARVAL